MLDCHCHLLHGVDDGPTTLDQAVTLARGLVAEGVSEAIATPHRLNPLFKTTDDRLLVSYHELQAALHREQIPLRIHLGAENHFSGALDVEQYLESAWALGPGRAVLIEVPDHRLPFALWDLVFATVRRGWIPIIAHAERHPQLLDDRDRLVRLFCRNGGLLQINTGDLAGGLAPCRRLARQLVREFPAHCLLASDCHDVSGRPPAWSAVPRRWRQLAPATLADLERRSTVRHGNHPPPRQPQVATTAPPPDATGVRSEATRPQTDDSPSHAPVGTAAIPDREAGSVVPPLPRPSDREARIRTQDRDPPEVDNGDDPGTDRLTGFWARPLAVSPGTRAISHPSDLSSPEQALLERILTYRQEAESSAAFGRTENALIRLRSALDLVQRMPEDSRDLTRSRLLRLEADILLRDDHFGAAERCLQESLELARRISDRTGAVRCGFELARIQVRRGCFEQAAELFAANHSETEQLGDEALLVCFLAGWAWVLRRLKRDQQAVDVLEQALFLARRRRQDPELNELREQLARTLVRIGASERAMELFREQIVANAEGDNSWRWAAQYRLGRVLSDSGDPDAEEEALSLLQAAVESFAHGTPILGPDTPPEPLARMHYHLARCQLRQGRYDDALFNYRFAYREQSRTQQFHPAARCHLLAILKGMANCYWKLGQVDAAKERLNEAMVLASGLDGQLRQGIERALARIAG